MQARALGNALMIALISIVLMLGALSISLVEFVPESAPTFTPLPSPLPVTVTITMEPTVTPLLLESPVATITFTPTITTTPFRSCPIPAGWGQVVVQSYDTLESIAMRYQTGAAQLRNGNCLLSDSLVPGTVLYVPSVPINTLVACMQGLTGWIKNYVVKSGDTFYSISASYGVTSTTMKNANCHPSDLIYAGEILWVPNVPTRTPYPTPLPGNTAVPIPTDPLTETPLPYTTTPVPSSTPVPNTPISTYTPEPTLTASPTAFQ